MIFFRRFIASILCVTVLNLSSPLVAQAGVIGTLQATEVMKEILGLGETLAGRLLIYDARSSRFSEIRIAWDPANPLSGTAPSIRDLSLHANQTEGAVCVA